LGVGPPQQGNVTDHEPLKHSEHGTFGGQFATAIPTGISPKPMGVRASIRDEEPLTYLFAALTEGANQTALLKPDVDPTLLLACELFAGADFEATANARFLMLASVYEVLANPKKRPKPCQDLVEQLLDSAKKSEETAAANGERELKEAFRALRDSAAHLAKESITSSVRKLATRTSHVLGDVEPRKAGKRAVELYGKRSRLVHKGEDVTHAEVHELRTLVREALAVAAGCYDRIRERFPYPSGTRPN
jgi:hypothetical protein